MDDIVEDKADVYIPDGKVRVNNPKTGNVEGSGADFSSRLKHSIDNPSTNAQFMNRYKRPKPDISPRHDKFNPGTPPPAGKAKGNMEVPYDMDEIESGKSPRKKLKEMAEPSKLRQVFPKGVKASKETKTTSKIGDKGQFGNSLVQNDPETIRFIKDKHPILDRGDRENTNVFNVARSTKYCMDDARNKLIKGHGKDKEESVYEGLSKMHEATVCVKCHKAPCQCSYSTDDKSKSEPAYKKDKKLLVDKKVKEETMANLLAMEILEARKIERLSEAGVPSPYGRPVPEIGGGGGGGAIPFKSSGKKSVPSLAPSGTPSQSLKAMPGGGGDMGREVGTNSERTRAFKDLYTGRNDAQPEGGKKVIGKSVQKIDMNKPKFATKMKEDEELDELSRDTLTSYAKKSKADLSDRYDKNDNNSTKSNNRLIGNYRATKKLAGYAKVGPTANEEVKLCNKQDTHDTEFTGGMEVNKASKGETQTTNKPDGPTANKSKKLDKRNIKGVKDPANVSFKEGSQAEPVTNQLIELAVKALDEGKDKIEKTMHEFKHGTLHSGSKKGPKVTDRKQAIAIALNQERKAQHEDFSEPMLGEDGKKKKKVKEDIGPASGTGSPSDRTQNVKADTTFALEGGKRSLGTEKLMGVGSIEKATRSLGTHKRILHNTEKRDQRQITFGQSDE